MKMENTPNTTDYRKFFRSGMKVRIKSPAPFTDNKFSLVSSMVEMFGGEYIVGVVDDDRVWVNGFMWAGEDLFIIDENNIQDKIKGQPIKIDIVSFDPKELVI
jgi:hypothetical protein